MSNTTTPTIVLSDDDATAKALKSVITAAVNGAGKYVAYVEAHDVNRDNLADHARALASYVYPNEKPVQKTDGKRTKYGNAVQAAAAGLRTALGDDLTKKAPDYLALVRQAVKTAHDKGEVDTDAIMRAVTEALTVGE